MSKKKAPSSLQMIHRKAGSGTYSPVLRKNILDDVETLAPEKSLPSPNFGFANTLTSSESGTKYFKSTSTNSTRTEASPPRIVIIGRANRSPNRTSTYSVSSLLKKSSYTDQKPVSEQSIVIVQPIETDTISYNERINKLAEQKQSIEQKVLFLEDKIQKLTEENQRLQQQLQKKELMSIEAASSGKYSEMHSTLPSGNRNYDEIIYISGLETKGKEEILQAVQSVVKDKKEGKCASVSRGTQFDCLELFPIECVRCNYLNYECEGLLRKIGGVEQASSNLVKEYQLLEKECEHYKKMVDDLKTEHREKEVRLTTELRETNLELNEVKTELRELRQEIKATRMHIRENIKNGGIEDHTHIIKAEQTNQKKSVATPQRLKPPESIPAYLKALSLAKEVSKNEFGVNS